MPTKLEVLQKILWNTPYSFMSIHKKALSDGRSILDVGCSDGLFLSALIHDSKNYTIDGIDIFAKSLKAAKKRGLYQKLIKGDVVTVCASLIKKKKKYDIVLCSELIEHLDKKKGERLLKFLEKLARKRIIITTPNGYLEQQHEHVEKNPYEFHKSGWELTEFTQRGYQARGVGFKPIWPHHGIGRSKNRYVFLLANIFSFITAPIAYYFPRFSVGIFAVKTFSKKN